MKHRAAAFSRQPTLSYTAPLTSAHLVDLPFLGSFSTIFLHVVLGHLVLFFPSSCHSIATMQSSCGQSSSIFSFGNLSLNFFTLVTWEIVSFRMRYGHQILRVRLRHMNWNLSSFSSAVVSFHASHPYNRTGHTKALNSLTFVFRPILRVFQILIKLKNASCCLLRRFLISSMLLPFCHSCAQTLQRL